MLGLQGLSFLPVFLLSWSSANFIIPYLIAIYRNDVDVIFPYISDTGATPPESCIFGLMTFVTACAGVATVYARFKLVEKINEDTNLVQPCVNKAALLCGLISCFGMLMVATFQETAVIAAHDVGAGLFFLVGIVYIILQVVISYKAYPFNSSTCICWTRLAIAIVATVALFPTIICAALAKTTSLHIQRDDPNYPYHLASAICEWIMSFSFIFFFFTYVDEFKLFTLQVRTELQELP